ncbi:substrate-binding periplasmic protein [Pedobacter cryoconitis]|uniref:Polar amino acid transport system substrate-binding protein n=1 Tax=Pedobacter cryoconitis TaxID=188932 RepID=A0A327T1F0_9SPHI|nr:transporter substrate-binding domain-containing protein [Pedobacter cryoconitis]RAJ35470.1 polar amino acid transport system substrate-binding protein [Pedobacter cryoconitis]
MKRILKIGLDSAAPFPLHSDYNSSVFEGFEVDMIRAVAEVLDLELHYEVSLWKTILEKLYKGELDMICSAVTMTTSRQMILEFSKPYLQFQLCAVVNGGDGLIDLSSFKDKKIGIRTATEAEKYVMAQFPGNATVHTDTNDELYKKLLAHKIDVLIDDSPIVGGFLAKHQSLKIGMFMPVTESEYAIAMKKGDLALQHQINETLDLLRQNGVYDSIHDKWFNSIKLV